MGDGGGVGGRRRVLPDGREQGGRGGVKGVDPVTCLPLRVPRTAAGKPNLLSTYWPNYLLLPQIYFAY